jgi:excisionase family DNA binding protein
MIMEETEKTKWYGIKEAAEYLDVGEPTIYRWMREGKITYRKVGDSTRFWKEDLEAVMEVFHSTKAVDQVRALCPVCRHDELIDGRVQSSGVNYFRPKKTKFWTFRDGNVETQSKMCARCGAIVWFGDLQKLETLRIEEKQPAEADVVRKNAEGGRTK